MNPRRRPSLPLVLLAATLAPALLLAVRRRAAPSVEAVPFRPSGIYAAGERIGWTVRLPEGAPQGEYRYSLKRDNRIELRSGALAFDSGQAIVETRLDDPAMLTLLVTPPEGKPRLFGAAVEPTRLKPVVPRPADFDLFWKGKLAALRRIPANPVLEPTESPRPGIELQTLRLDGPGEGHTYGVLAKPRKPGRYPAIAVFQWASPPYPLQKSWSVDAAAKGFIVLNVEPHDVLPLEPPAYYQALSNEQKNYGSVGQKDREKNAFVQMYLRDVRALDYLRSLPDWDGKTLVVMGGSMGGQQSLAAAGLVPQVTHLIVEEPAGCDLNAGRHGRQQGYPYYPVGDPQAMETARYIDAVNFAPEIRAVSLVAMGFVDVVAPPTGIWTAFNLIEAPKEAAPMPDAPHNNLATREQLMPIIVRREAWLESLASTGRVEVRGGVGKPLR